MIRCMRESKGTNLDCRLMSTRHDETLIVRRGFLYLSFFLMMTSFLFYQGIGLALYNLLATVVLITALSGLYQERAYEFPWQTLRKSFWMIVQAMPLMIIMFVVLPRMPSFWNIPLQENSSQTGMSDQMSPAWTVGEQHFAKNNGDKQEHN